MSTLREHAHRAFCWLGYASVPQGVEMLGLLFRMGHRMKSPCLEPRCGNLATYRGRCADHSKQREGQINRAGKKVYSRKRWAMTRRRKLSLNPMCERCGKALADTVHHKVDIAEGGGQYAMENLAAWCASCHSQETRQRQLGRAS